MQFSNLSLTIFTPISLLLILLPSVLSAPQPIDIANIPENTLDRRSASEDDYLPMLIPREASPTLVSRIITPDLLKRQAGLAWGPIYIGNLKLSLTNPHDGYAGPKFPNANHVNFHVDKKEDGDPRQTYNPVVNMHIVKYENGEGSQCLYIWESQTDSVVFDSCFDDFTDAIQEGVSAVKEFVDDLLKEADFIASFAIIAALVVALVAALTTLGAVAVA